MHAWSITPTGGVNLMLSAPPFPSPPNEGCPRLVGLPRPPCPRAEAQSVAGARSQTEAAAEGADGRRSCSSR